MSWTISAQPRPLPAFSSKLKRSNKAPVAVMARPVTRTGKVLQFPGGLPVVHEEMTDGKKSRAIWGLGLAALAVPLASAGHTLLHTLGLR